MSVLSVFRVCYECVECVQSVFRVCSKCVQSVFNDLSFHRLAHLVCPFLAFFTVEILPLLFFVAPKVNIS